MFTNCKMCNVRSSMLPILIKSLCISHLLNKPFFGRNNNTIFFAIFFKFSTTFFNETFVRKTPFKSDIYWAMVKKWLYQNHLRKNVLFIEMWIFSEIWAGNDFLKWSKKDRPFNRNVNICGNLGKKRFSKWSQNSVLFFKILIFLYI